MVDVHVVDEADAWLVGHSVAKSMAAIPALIAAWPAATGSFTRGPGPMARASHGIDAAAQHAASRTLTTSVGAGMAARDMAAIASRAGPVGVLGTAGIAVSIQIMAPPISAGRTAGRLRRRTPPDPTIPASPNQSAALPSRAACRPLSAAPPRPP